MANFCLSVFAAFPASSEATHPLSLATWTGRLRGWQRKSERPQVGMGAGLGEWKMVEGRFFFSQGGKALQVRGISQERGRRLGRRRWKRGRWKRDLREAGGWWKRGLGGKGDLGEARGQFQSEAYAGGRQCVLIPLKTEANDLVWTLFHLRLCSKSIKKISPRFFHQIFYACNPITGNSKQHMLLNWMPHHSSEEGGNALKWQRHPPLLPPALFFVRKWHFMSPEPYTSTTPFITFTH